MHFVLKSIEANGIKLQPFWNGTPVSWFEELESCTSIDEFGSSFPSLGSNGSFSPMTNLEFTLLKSDFVLFVVRRSKL